MESIEIGLPKSRHVAWLRPDKVLARGEPWRIHSKQFLFIERYSIIQSPSTHMRFF